MSIPGEPQVSFFLKPYTMAMTRVLWQISTNEKISFSGKNCGPSRAQLPALIWENLHHGDFGLEASLQKEFSCGLGLQNFPREF
jgi:hypothetical protein